MMTVRELRALLEPYDEDLPVEVGIERGEAGTQKEAIDVTYATGTGRCNMGGGSCVIIEYLLSSRDIERGREDANEEEDLLTCPFCGETILTCPHCKENL